MIEIKTKFQDFIWVSFGIFSIISREGQHFLHAPGNVKEEISSEEKDYILSVMASAGPDETVEHPR